MDLMLLLIAVVVFCYAFVMLFRLSIMGFLLAAVICGTIVIEHLLR